MHSIKYICMDINQFILLISLQSYLNLLHAIGKHLKFTYKLVLNKSLSS